MYVWKAELKVRVFNGFSTSSGKFPETYVLEKKFNLIIYLLNYIDAEIKKTHIQELVDIKKVFRKLHEEEDLLDVRTLVTVNSKVAWAIGEGRIEVRTPYERNSEGLKVVLKDLINDKETSIEQVYLDWARIKYGKKYGLTDFQKKIEESVR